MSDCWSTHLYECLLGMDHVRVNSILSFEKNVYMVIYLVILLSGDE